MWISAPRLYGTSNARHVEQRETRTLMTESLQNGRRGSMRMATPVRGADAWLSVATLLEFPARRANIRRLVKKEN